LFRCTFMHCFSQRSINGLSLTLQWRQLAQKELHWMIHLKCPRLVPLLMHADLQLLLWNLTRDSSPVKVSCISKQAHLIVLLRMTQRDCVSDEHLNAGESRVVVGHLDIFIYSKDLWDLTGLWWIGLPLTAFQEFLYRCPVTGILWNDASNPAESPK